MGSRRAGSIVAAVTLTIAAAFAIVTLLFVHAGRDTAIRYTESTTDLYSSALFFEFAQSDLDLNTIEKILTSYGNDEGVRSAIIAPDGTVLASSRRFLLPGINAFDAIPSIADQRDQLVPDESSHIHAWVGLHDLIPRSQVFYGIRYCPNLDAYLLIENSAHGIFTDMRQQVSTLVVGLVVTMVLLMLLVMFIVRWYRAKLIRVATTDELTGLANRKSFVSSYESLAHEGKLSRSTLALVDVDLFKHVNDTYGHAAGDEALAAVAAELKTLAGSDGLAGRWGGDEFIALLGKPIKEAQERIEETIRRIAALELKSGARISVSVGAAEVDAEKPLERMVERCDDALYVTKEGGRGFLTLYEEGVTPHMAFKSTNPGKVGVIVSRSAKETKEHESHEQSLRLTQRPQARHYVNLVIKSLLEAVHHMVPFVAAGGILIAIAFLIDGTSVDLSALSPEERAAFGSITPLAAGLSDVGSAAFNFMLPIFAAFFARGLGGPEAFMAGFAGGYLASQGSSGFLGAILAAVIAGVVCNLMRGFIAETSRQIQRIAPVLLYPLFSLLVMYLLLRFVVGPIAISFEACLTSILNNLAQGNRTVLGGVMGAMMATDLGGPINKTAYHFGTASILIGEPDIMAAVMLGGMVPPCGIALSMLLFRNRFTQDERDTCASTLFMGLAFITEGAIPFAITDLFRVIPSCMVGSAVASALSEAFGCTLMAPHGGIFVFPVVGNAALYLLSLFLGSIVCALVLGVLKRPLPEQPEEAIAAGNDG